MTAAINVCQALPSDDGACLQGVTKGAPGKAKSEKAQLPFAETPALVKVREESKAGESGVVAVAEKDVGGGERIVAATPKACNPSAKGTKQGNSTKQGK